MGSPHLAWSQVHLAPAAALPLVRTLVRVFRHDLCGSCLALESWCLHCKAGGCLTGGGAAGGLPALTTPSPQMPVCSYFLKGVCSNSNCPYSHVYVSRKAEVCTDFLKGYCPLGAKVRGAAGWPPQCLPWHLQPPGGAGNWGTGWCGALSRLLPHLSAVGVPDS